MSKPKILIVDIETAPAIAYVWRLFDVNISVEQLISPSRMICAAFKWHGKAGVTCYSEWEDGTLAMLTGLRDAINEADAVVTYNGDKFDIPKLNGEFVSAGLEPAAPCTSIDVVKTVKKLGLTSNKLAFVGPFFKIGQKLKHEGFELWSKVLDGAPKARETMIRYNKQDVVLLGQLYSFLRPYMTTHPHIQVDGECPNCGSDNVQNRGFRYTRTTKTQRIQCTDCGAWSSGARSKIK